MCFNISKCICYITEVIYCYIAKPKFHSKPYPWNGELKRAGAPRSKSISHPCTYWNPSNEQCSKRHAGKGRRHHLKGPATIAAVSSQPLWRTKNIQLAGQQTKAPRGHWPTTETHCKSTARTKGHPARTVTVEKLQSINTEFCNLQHSRATVYDKWIPENSCQKDSWGGKKALIR